MIKNKYNPIKQCHCKTCKYYYRFHKEHTNFLYKRANRKLRHLNKKECKAYLNNPQELEKLFISLMFSTDVVK